MNFDIGANTSYSEIVCRVKQRPFSPVLLTWAVVQETEAEVEPEMVEVNGQIWKRTMSAMGTSYY